MCDQRYINNPALLWRRTFDRLIVLVPGHPDVVSLTGTGIALFYAFDEPRSLPEAVGVLGASYDAPAERIAADVGPLVGTFIERGVIVPWQ